MVKSRRLRKAMSLLCVICVMLSLFANGAVAVAADREAAAEDAVEAQDAALGESGEALPDEAAEDQPDDAWEVSDPDPEEALLSSDTAEEIVPAAEETGSRSAPAERAGDTRSSTSANLADFLTNVTINAPVDENGNYVINPNSTYEMTLAFHENEDIQFDDEGVLFYDFPQGVVINDIGATAFSIKVVDQNGTASVSDNLFEVVNGQLRVTFNQNDPNFERLKAMPNVEFSVAISSSFDQTAGEIVFNPTIVKSFVYDDQADLTITKNVVYDQNTDTASYVVQVTSAGTNEQVVIEDRLTGTALIFNQDVVIESNINGTLPVTPDYGAVERGYRVTIPQLENGEILTLRYTARVDNTKISGNGTVAQTNNTVRVTSDQVPDGKEASANFAGQATFQRIRKQAVGDPVPVGDGLYEQTWKIVVNQDHKMPMGGTRIHDWITVNSRPFMTFTGDGLAILVTMENGDTETRNVPWSALQISTSGDGTPYGWSYLTPETDGKAAYEITLKTLIDSSGALNTLTLANGAQVHNSYDEGQTTVGVIGENVFNIQKDAIGTTDTESEWKITVSIPGGGLSDLRVTDDLPKLEYGGQTYIDYFVDGSMEIEGLLEGESWRVSFNENQRTFTLAFYKTGTQNSANAGLLPTTDGQPRDIVIRFKTAVNQDWLNLAAEDGYETSLLYTHRNTASARSGDFRLPSVNDVVYPAKPAFEKEFVERTEAVIDGVTYPVFHYVLAMSGPTADGIVIHDTFDTQYLKFYEAGGVKVSGGTTAAASEAVGTASAADTADGVDITVNQFPMLSADTYYPFYRIEYALIVKDAAALEQLNANAAESQDGVTLENTATWNDFSSTAQASYTYFPYVDKELLTRPTADNGYVAEFKVVINKYAEDLDPTSDVLAIRDILSSNLRFIPDSLVITPANDAIVVQHDEETNTLSFTEVPDETTFEITYQARVLGSGNVTYSNTIQFGKYEKTVEENATVASSGGGTASNPSITLVKRDAEMVTNTLAGATFQLFYIQNGNQVPVRDSGGQNVTFTTGADGRVLIVGNLQTLGWTLWADRTYCLVETTAPAGYVLDPEPIYFVLTESPSSQMEYDITGDQLSVRNDPIKISIPVVKQWIGPAAESVVVNLLADDVAIDEAELSAFNDWQYIFTDLPKYDGTDGHEIRYDVTEEPLAGYDQGRSGTVEEGFTFTNTNNETLDIPVTKQWIGPAAESVVVNLLADDAAIDEAELSASNDWQHTFTDLPKYDSTDGHEIRYDVTEEPLAGYDQGRSGTVEEGFTFTNTNIETIDIPVTKQWIGPAAESVVVNLLADDVAIDEVELSASNGWQHTFTDLPKYDSTDGHEIRYDVTEEPLAGYEQSRSGTVEEGFTFTNTNNETIDIPVTKRWVGPAADTVTIRLLADGAVIATAELNAGADWRHTFAGLPKYDSTDGHEIRYTIQEEPVTGYTASIAGDAHSGFVVTNTQIPTTPAAPPKVPGTGDNSPVSRYFLALLLSGAGLAGTLLLERKRRRTS